MQYRCTSCKENFDVPEGDRPRCPKCLRIHDVEPIEEAASPISRYRGPLILFTIVALSLGAYAAWYFSQGEETPAQEAPVEVGPLAAEKLRSVLERHNFKQSEVVEPFAGSAKITEFARQAVHGEAEPRAKAQAVMDAIRALLDENHELYISIAPRVRAPQNPEETLAALRSSEPFEPYSYELAALLVTACRSVGVPAVLAEVYRFESVNRPTDPSGVQGYFVAALPRGEGGSYQRPVLFDPASGRSDESAAGDADVLTDVEAVSALLTLKGLYLAANSGDSAGGERLTTLAVRLRPTSATTRAARGTVRLLGGGGELSATAALEEYQRALSQRADPQRKVLVARVLLAGREIRQAEELVRSALSDMPDFAAAHGLMGLIHTANGRLDEAADELATAERLEPRDPQLQLLWVQYHVAQRDIPAAIEAAQNVVDRVPDDPQPRLMLTQVLHEDARYEAVQTQCRELLRRNPGNEQLRELLSEAFDCDTSAGEADAGEAVASSDEQDGGAEEEEGDGGADVDGGGDGGSSLQLQMGQGLGKLRLGGAGGFQLNPGL